MEAYEKHFFAYSELFAIYSLETSIFTHFAICDSHNILLSKMDGSYSTSQMYGYSRQFVNIIATISVQVL